MEFSAKFFKEIFSLTFKVQQQILIFINKSDSRYERVPFDYFMVVFREIENDIEKIKILKMKIYFLKKKVKIENEEKYKKFMSLQF